MIREVLVKQPITFSLPSELADRVHEVIALHRAESLDAFIEEAVRRELKRIEEERLNAELTLAMQDPQFVRDLEETMHAFRFADSETARMLDAEEARQEALQ